MIENFEQLKGYCVLNNRICPEPTFWNELWQKLKEKKQINGKWDPALPLILAAWWESSIILKKLRFFEHLEWADQHGQFLEIAEYLLKLSEDQWFHSD